MCVVLWIEYVFGMCDVYVVDCIVVGIGIGVCVVCLVCVCVMIGV